MATVYEIVKDAIQNKKIVLAMYDGYERIMCPHVLGTKKGRHQALFYQFAGGSRSGLSRLEGSTTPVLQVCDRGSAFKLQ